MGEKKRKILRLENEMVGYYDHLGKLLYAPPIPGKCPVCGEEWRAEDVCNVAPAWSNPDASLRPLQLFFRLHKSCRAECSDREMDALCAQALLVGDRVARARQKLSS